MSNSLTLAPQHDNARPVGRRSAVVLQDELHEEVLAAIVRRHAVEQLVRVIPVAVQECVQSLLVRGDVVVREEAAADWGKELR